MECKKCCLTIDCRRDVFTVCEGSCCRAFHASCIHLSEDSVRYLKGNIIWLCDDCLSAYRKHIIKGVTEVPESENASKVDNKLADIEGKIGSIMEALAVISEAQKKSIPYVTVHSTPNRSPKLHEGSRFEEIHSASEQSISTMSTNAASRRPLPHRGRHQEKSFALFLTNVDRRVTERDITSMVSRSLGVEENEVMNVKKLVSKWHANDSLDYVSFKVQLCDNLKTIALREDSWPSGLMYREFIERPRVIWKPTGWV